MSVKDRIIQLRKDLGLNQTELAKRAGLKPPAISQYESGVRNPSYDALLKLASA
jgi:transcriptional regulator with XRE-family HTH domain